MVKRVGGPRKKARHKLKKNYRDRGKISLRRYLQEFKVGDRVYLVVEPAVQKADFHMRFSGKAGVIKGKRGNCYEVLIKDIKKEKLLIVHPVHLKSAK